ncbi:COQ9 family protein [Pseudoroseicyclus tamaricis]|uniref:COQ9 family protein n=1 Tax=Pseudoroseicyclus tamaricis TaxID=2705421 RepID=A0A6B2JWQ4_9RHOB|nr:COQ9 family protein [Pseudoroseicyclus tamaricis]NDV02335.1 COQ9 family protein [Pseudoroseicyclus tamaricis]
MSQDALLSAMLTHVPFDGWSEESFRAAARDAGLTPAEARAYAPRGPVSLAAAHHRRGDAALAETLMGKLDGLRYSEKVARAVEERLRLAGDTEVLRRSAALFSLPQNAPLGSRLIWETSDTIWRVLGDTSTDGNWYSKRAILSAVYSSSMLYWLGDQSEGQEKSRGFIERRIAEVMRFEETKARLRKNPLFAPGFRLFEGIRAPKSSSGLPGRWDMPS